MDGCRAGKRIFRDILEQRKGEWLWHAAIRCAVDQRALLYFLFMYAVSDLHLARYVVLKDL